MFQYVPILKRGRGFFFPLEYSFLLCLDFFINSLADPRHEGSMPAFVAEHRKASTNSCSLLEFKVETLLQGWMLVREKGKKSTGH